jgi:hypothetical protein
LTGCKGLTKEGLLAAPLLGHPLLTIIGIEDFFEEL